MSWIAAGTWAIAAGASLTDETRPLTVSMGCKMALAAPCTAWDVPCTTLSTPCWVAFPYEVSGTWVSSPARAVAKVLTKALTGLTNPARGSLGSRVKHIGWLVGLRGLIEYVTH
jgi:hypothetical protein